MIRLLLFFLSLNAYSAGDPFLVESKVQADLEASLSRMLSREQFLVQATAEIVTRSERKVVEGEMVKLKNPKQQKAVVSMPGFRPDASPKVPSPPEQIRQVYRMVEKPELKVIRVQVSLDEELASTQVDQAKRLTQTYLRANYPNRARLLFLSIPMLKPNLLKEEKKKEEPVLAPPVEEPDWQSKYGLWIMGALGALVLYLLMRNKTQAVKQAPAPQKSTRRRTRRPSQDMVPSPQQMWPQQFPFMGMPNSQGAQDKNQALSQPTSTDSLDGGSLELRNRFLQKILSRSDAFRQYFTKLSSDEQTELYSCLKGPAFDNFLAGIEVPRPVSDGPEPQDVEESLLHFEKDFLEYNQTAEWQDKQFFGFLQSLTDEQLMTIISHENPFTACLMLRFMKANQSARVLDALPPPRRLDILSQLKSIQQTPLSELATVEKSVRSSIDRMPTHLFGVGAKREDVDYWGTVLSESDNQDGILEDLERTQPEIYPDLKKFRFKLEDVAAMPDGILKTVLGETDNKELGMALTTCNKDVSDVIMDSLSPKRREVLENEMSVYRSIDKSEARDARVALTKRFREAMA